MNKESNQSKIFMSTMVKNLNINLIKQKNMKDIIKVRKKCLKQIIKTREE